MTLTRPQYRSLSFDGKSREVSLSKGAVLAQNLASYPKVGPSQQELSKVKLLAGIKNILVQMLHFV